MMNAAFGWSAQSYRHFQSSDCKVALHPVATLTDTDLSINAPAEVVAGSEIDVSWIGPDNRNDYIAIVKAGADEGTSINYSYTREGSPLELKTVDHPGVYEIRYVSAQFRNTLAMFEITLTEAEVSIEAPSEAVAGAEIEVAWIGPDNQNDYIAIVEAGADEGTSINYAYTRKGSPLDLKTVDRSGVYEIRYVSGQSRETMATATINLTEPVVSLDIPAEAIAGASIDITWVGPDNQNDYITIVEVGADEGTSINYAYTRRGAPLELQTVDRAGGFEVRYVSGQSKATLASQPITLIAPEVSLVAAPVAFAGNKISVNWIGPDNKNDYIAIVHAGADEGQSETYQYTRRGNPVEINVPDETGDYEIRYVSGQSRATLATQALSLEAE